MTRIVRKFQVDRGRAGQRHLVTGGSVRPAVPIGRLPRITRLMALAIRFEELIRSGIVNDQAEIARLGNVTRARVTQIMNLLHLAPDIQEAILNLPRVQQGKDRLHLKGLLPLTAECDWHVQREHWGLLQNAQD